MRSEVLVVGGGPSGAAAALLLARAGRRVTLLEKARFPRRKVCGEFIAADGIAMLRALGLGEAFDAAAGPEIRRLALWAGERAIEAPMPAPYARALARETLDTLLLEQARSQGVEVLLESRSGKVVIDATGSWHKTEQPTELLGFKAHWRDADFREDTIALIPFPGGYAGLVGRGGGRATLACTVRRETLDGLRWRGVPAAESLRQFLVSECRELRRALGAGRREGAWLAAGPLRPGARPVWRGGRFAVGNAAGEAHAIVGEGVSMALRSAALLADPLAAALESGWTREAERAVAREYALRWRRAFALRLWASARFAGLAMGPRPHAWLERLLGAAPGLLGYGAKLARL